MPHRRQIPGERSFPRWIFCWPPRTLCLPWTPSLTPITLLFLHSRCLSLTALGINCLIHIQFPEDRDLRSSRHLKGIVSNCDGYKHHPGLMRSGDGIQIWYLSICIWIFGPPRNLSTTYTNLIALWLSRLWLFCMQRAIPKSWHRVEMSHLSLVWELPALWAWMSPDAVGREGDKMCASVIHWGFALGEVTGAVRSWLGQQKSQSGKFYRHTAGASCHISIFHFWKQGS